MSNNKVETSPAWEAVLAFDAENGVEPFRTIAERIASKYGVWLVDEISAALEDSYNLGERRGPLVKAACARPGD